MIIYRLEIANDNKTKYMIPSYSEEDLATKKFFQEFGDTKDFSLYKETPKMYWQKKWGTSKFKKIPDYAHLGLGNCHIFSQRAIDVLGDILSKYGEYRLVENIDEENTNKYYVYNLKKEIDCLDREKTRAKFKDDLPVIYVKEYWLYGDKIDPNVEIFQIKHNLFHAFVTQRFIDRCVENNLKNMEFRPIWSSEIEHKPYWSPEKEALPPSIILA
jgi:hypothetical protein